jgi:hypothetical protein
MAAPKKITTATETKQTILDAYGLAIEEARQEFENDKVEQLAAWKTELARKKEEDLYQYNKEKRAREDTFEEEFKERMKAVIAREASVEERENIVSKQEEAFDELQGKVNDIPVLIENAKAAGYATAKVETKKQCEFDHQLAQAKWDADQHVLENRITSLTDTKDAQERLINTLQGEVKSANSRVETIATSAVNAAGNNKVTVNTAQTK